MNLATSEFHSITHYVDVKLCSHLCSVLRETREVACMNNYFGIGLDAQIAYQFHNTREKNQIK